LLGSLLFREQRYDLAAVLVFCNAFIWVVFFTRNIWIKTWYSKLLVAGLCLSVGGWLIDVSHLIELFVPQTYDFNVYRFHVPKEVKLLGFSERLIVPHWDHQLRDAYLFVTLLAVPLALYNLYQAQSRANIFLGVNAVVSFLVITSPPLFTALASVIPETSVYRIQLLIFAPMIIGSFLQTVGRRGRLGEPEVE